MEHPYWNSHYRSFDVQRPSSFSQYCAQRHLNPADVLVELGCGNGRDARMIAGHVAQYIGVDICGVAIEAFARSLERLSFNGHPPPRLVNADFSAMDFDALVRGAPRLVLYSRFTLHSITYEEQERLFDRIAAIRASPWMLLVEARTIHDRLHGVGRQVGLHEYETDHYRRFIDPSAFLKDVSARFTLRYFEVANGFAAHGAEDPVVLRAVIQGDAPEYLS